MSPRVFAIAVAALGWTLAFGAPVVHAMTLDEAITLARRNNPQMAQSGAQAAAAAARLTQARAALAPSLTLTGEAGQGNADFGGFFGFGEADMSPRVAAVELRQPLFAGGAILAGVDRARAGRDAALAQAAGAKALLSARVAEVYAAQFSARELVALNETQVAQMLEAVRQAELRFAKGDVARTEVSQAKTRLAEARAGLARAQGALALGRARFVSVVGVEPEGLEPTLESPAAPATLDEAVAQALRGSPTLRAAEAGLRAAEAGVRQAQAGRLPNLSLAATASTTRDKFFPGYKADDVTVGVQGRWTLFAGGAINGRVSEARADLRAAQAARDAAQAAVREAVVGAWSDLATARALQTAAAEQVAAAQSALEDVRNEVRVGEKPMLDLLDAQREHLNAQSALSTAKGDVVTSAHRLRALLGDTEAR